jgi:hypothetical protein
MRRNSVGLSKGKCIVKGDTVFIGNVQIFALLFPAVTHLAEGETLLTLKLEKSLI